MLEKITKRIYSKLLPSKKANLVQCSEDELWNDYFADAEKCIDNEWNEVLWPIIQHFDLSTVLELAPGAGRNTERLATVSKQIHAVDFNAYALKQCKARMDKIDHSCDISFHRNDGTNLNMIKDSSITAIYCWDAAVHFDKEIIADYIKELSRVMKPGAQGFIHHSNLGERANDNIKKNPGWRSNASKTFFAEHCEKHGLTIVKQIDHVWAEDLTDCISVFKK